MKGTCSVTKLIGISMLTFGIGILLSFFLPETILVVLEAVLIIGAGFLYFAGP